MWDAVIRVRMTSSKGFALLELEAISSHAAECSDWVSLSN